MKGGIGRGRRAAAACRRLGGISRGGRGIYISTHSGGARRCDVAYHICATRGHIKSYPDGGEKLSDGARARRKAN